jgi:exodeoxyribonuclease VII large subunit
MRSYTVGEVSVYLSRRLELDPKLRDLWIRGEASNCTRSSGGHMYWTLKDGNDQLACVMFRSQAVLQRTRPQDGAHLSCHGEVKAYASRSQYQLVVDHIEPVGLGDLYVELERRKAALAAEGLFDEGVKRPLPVYPNRIGVVTSVEGSVLSDIRTTLQRRWPLARVVVAHTQVQGAASAPDVADAIRQVGRARVDVILLARGGGSLEDLWAFNEEAVVRAIRAAPVPVVCGVGHETDTTLADLAADVRAATPTAAAELTVPDRHQMRLAVDRSRSAADGSLLRRLANVRQAVDSLKRRSAISSPGARLARQRRSLTESEVHLERAATSHLRELRRRTASLTVRLDDLSPVATLARGYAHVRRAVDGVTVIDPIQAPAGTTLTIRVEGGSFGATASEAVPGEKPS